jgi:membrane protease YdiL (CAAX protease family)
VIAAGDPLGFAAIGHLLLFGLVLPAAAWVSGRRLDRTEFPPKPQYFGSVIVQQLILGSLSLAAAWRLGLELFPPFRPTVTDALLALGFLAVSVALAEPQWRRAVDERDRRVYLFSPRTGLERGLWVGISFAAGIFEEVAYRGVMFWVVRELTGSIGVAVAICALAFGLGHLVQGVKAAAFVTLIGAGFHGMVLATGSLYPAIVAHVVFDLIAGFRYGRLADQAAYPAMPLPPLTDSSARTPS